MEKKEQRSTAEQLYQEGYGISEIAVKIDANENTLRSWKRRDGWQRSASQKVVQKIAERKAAKKEVKRVLDEEAAELMQNENLTSKQKIFIAYYVSCWNATQAYQKAYGCSRKTAGAAGYNLLKKTVIQKAIEDLQRQKMASAMHKRSRQTTAEPQQTQEVERTKMPQAQVHGAVGTGLSKSTPRPDQNGPHRGVFERNKKRIYATQQVCGICGHPVDFDLKYPHPLSPCIDHIIPIAKGGHPSDIENLQLAHWTCNRQKSDKLLRGQGSIANEEEMISNRVLPQSADWRNF